MTNNKSTSIGSRMNSAAYAFKGLKHLIKFEPNARIHLVVTVLVIITGLIMQLDRVEWVAIVFSIGIVWIAEGFNTCVELLCDLYCERQYNSIVAVIKDISAGVVLIASIVSIVTGIIVFFFRI